MGLGHNQKYYRFKYADVSMWRPFTFSEGNLQQWCCFVFLQLSSFVAFACRVSMFLLLHHSCDCRISLSQHFSVTFVVCVYGFFAFPSPHCLRRDLVFLTVPLYFLFVRARSLGVHCSKVRSLTLDSWEPELLKVCLSSTFASPLHLARKPLRCCSPCSLFQLHRLLFYPGVLADV